MDGTTAFCRRTGGWFFAIFLLGTLNAIGDMATLILALATSFNQSFLLFRVLANEKLFFVAGTLTLLCNVLFLVFILRRNLFLFQLFFFASGIIALVHLLVNLIALYPVSIFDILATPDIYTGITGIYSLAPELLQQIYPALLILGTLFFPGLLFVCFLYFRRSKQIQIYFGFKDAR
jgi:hypothetical protein